MRQVTIDPVTRIEGHGRVEIILDDSGEVSSAYFVVPEFRGFEQLCVGRPVEEMPSLTSRVCGLCPEAHHLASAKALDTLFGVEPPPAVRVIRELLYTAFVVSNHATHFFALAGPDFLTGDEESIAALTEAVGFRFAYLEEAEQFAHAAGIVALTPQGQVARYFYGVEYAPKDVRLGLIEAADNKIGSLVDQVLLYCFHYDPTTGKYTAVAMNIVRLGAAVTVTLIGLFLIIHLRRERQTAAAEV